MIEELELNFSNLCGGNCFFCSKAHGSGNASIMTDNVFNTLIKQLVNIEIGKIQTSGNGEVFLNPNFLNYLIHLKGCYDGQVECYNNFSMMTNERADAIISKDLLTKISVRIESLDAEVMERSSRLNQGVVFKNLEYFISTNKKIEIVILYSNAMDYYNLCQKVLGHTPQYWPFRREEHKIIKLDEKDDILKRFKKYDKNNMLKIIRLDHCLWAERERTPPRSDLKCIRIHKSTGMGTRIWVSPDGTCSVCGYDDKQTAFTCGNILNENLMDIFNGKRRKRILNDIMRGRTAGKYPCQNPECCVFMID